MNTEPLKSGDRVTFVEYARTVVAEVIGNDNGLLFVEKDDGRRRWIRAEYVSRARETATSIYALDVTRKHRSRSRLRWYFDSENQFERAWALAVEHGDNPMRTGRVPYVPDDDIVTDADEFSAWLVGVA